VDFYNVVLSEPDKNEKRKLGVSWKVGRTQDLMVRGRSFYAVWDEAVGLWSTDEYDVQRLVDEHLYEEAKKHGEVTVLSLQSFATQSWVQFRRYLQNISDNSHPLDEQLTFANTVVKKTDYVSRRLPYSLEPGPCPAWDEIVGTLYSDEERAKLEWAIGAIVSGDAKKLQKFLVLYGPAGSGKSTILNIIQKMFAGYVATFDAKALGSNNGAFSTEVFRHNPLVAIQHDGDLSKIEDNTKLNSIVSHEEIVINEKYKPGYGARVNAFLFMGTNQPVKISDAKSGLIRRLIDVHPSGKHIETDRYFQLMAQADFELGAIASQCLARYKAMGKNFYSAYRPLEMMFQTDVFYNYVEGNQDVFTQQGGVSLKQAYTLYKQWCSDTGIDKILPMYKMREELRNYFEEFHDRYTDDSGVAYSSYYKGFKPLIPIKELKVVTKADLGLAEQPSLLDAYFADQPAQLAKPSGNPGFSWVKVKTTLKNIDTSHLHFVKVPEDHIVIDFDLTDENGEKSLARNLDAASIWPATYAEVSKSGAGLHLHYQYAGNVHELAQIFDVGIEVKTLLGDASLRRKLTKCNKSPVAQIGGGLPKKEKPMLDIKSVQTERSLRELVDRNLRKEIHPGTKPSVDFIHKILDDAYNDGLSYDLTDMRSKILTFAASSHNQAAYCISLVQKMRFVGQDHIKEVVPDDDKPIVFYDVEVYPNLFVVCWKYDGMAEVVRMVNPTAQELEPLLSLRLVGFNNRRYDNHIIYARYTGATLEKLYKLSQSIIDNKPNVLFGEAYNLSYADIYDFSSKKQSLKKFEVELGIHHMELDIPWDQPVPEDRWDEVVAYCVNDVHATEATFHARKQDFIAREILAELSGLSINHTTQNHTAKIIFGDDKQPQNSFVYTELNKAFPGYLFDGKESTYRDEVVGEGGYVYAEPGIYANVALLDVASMHPTSIEVLDMFGPYTQNFSDLKAARLAIKRKEYEKARSMLGGRLQPFLVGAEDDPKSAEGLSYALKIVINIVYGLTSAKFPNPFRDERNVDNIVAKRGALFMIDLKHAVQEQGFTVAHIKTDSIKIPNATPEIIDFVMKFGEQYGYEFEHENTYEKLCLVNDAVYVARANGKWSATGAQFQHPYVFKSLFTEEELEFEDFCEARSVVQGRMYLNFKDISDDPPIISEMHHVGRTGVFVPVTVDGGRLLRIKDDKSYAVTGTKGHLWIERDTAKHIPDLPVDMSYFENLAEKALNAIAAFGGIENLLS